MATIGTSWESAAADRGTTPTHRSTPLLDAWQTIERFACAGAALLLSPLAAGLATIVAVASKQSPFVAHRRVGQSGQVLWVWKFRTMWETAPQKRSIRIIEYLQEPDVPLTKSPDDPRVTHPFARWMRRYSLDELPQLIQVVTGRMAAAGPRPLTAKELNSHYGQASDEVLSVKPGITGMWQICGRSRLTYEQRLQLDLEYVRRRSLRLYWWILLRTLPAIFRGEDAY